MVMEVNLKIAKFHADLMFGIIPAQLIVNWIDGGINQVNSNPLIPVDNNTVITFRREIGEPLPAFYDTTKFAEKGIDIAKCFGTTDSGENLNQVTFNMNTTVYMINANQSDDPSGIIYDWSVSINGWSLIDISDGEHYMGTDHGLLKLYKKEFTPNNITGIPYIFDNRYCHYLFSRTPTLIVNWVDGGVNQANSNPLTSVDDYTIITFHGKIGEPVTFVIVDLQLPAYYDASKFAEKGIYITECRGTTDAGENLNYVTFNMETVVYMINGNQDDDPSGTIYDWSVPIDGWTLIDDGDGEHYMGIDHGLLKLYKKIFTANNVCGSPYIFDNRYTYYLFAESNNPFHSQSKCCRTNILNNLHIEDNIFDNIEKFISGNSVASTIGLKLPIDHFARIAEIKDIMTRSSQQILAGEIEDMKDNLFEESIDKIIGVDNNKSIQVNIGNNKLIRHAIAGNNNDKIIYKNALAQHMSHFLSNGDFGNANNENFINPTNPNIETLGTSSQAADLIEQLIIQSINSCSYNKLFGALNNNDPIIADYVDGNNQFYFLHFNIGDSLTFKQTVNINNVDLTINYNIIITNDTDSALNTNRGLGPILGIKMNS
tara:strand:+ start:1190 stop:2989 length:1800 start_codon:yes stop_codon:yes gene_type:complete